MEARYSFMDGTPNRDESNSNANFWPGGGSTEDDMI
jgi:hypothetical protein